MQRITPSTMPVFATKKASADNANTSVQLHVKGVY